MNYKQLPASTECNSLIKSFWTVDSQGKPDQTIEKIIPDGYPEIIYHYKDPYEANISGTWETQDKFLLAGQIKKHFFLRNTGAIGMIGIKMMPTALYDLFQIDMSQITNKVVNIGALIPNVSQLLMEILRSQVPFEKKVKLLEHFFEKEALILNNQKNICTQAIDLIIKSDGIISINEIVLCLALSERNLERHFNKSVGLSPKFYSRIIRLGKVFNLLKADKIEWTAIAHLCGYYDQAHFIKNFKEFTGEDPTKYLIEHSNMANLFLLNNNS
jgi:AraC-like DNA-binding protein